MVLVTGLEFCVETTLLKERVPGFATVVAVMVKVTVEPLIEVTVAVPPLVIVSDATLKMSRSKVAITPAVTTPVPNSVNETLVSTGCKGSAAVNDVDRVTGLEFCVETTPLKERVPGLTAAVAVIEKVTVEPLMEVTAAVPPLARDSDATLRTARSKVATMPVTWIPVVKDVTVML